jgi:hypothetical protein
MPSYIYIKKVLLGMEFLAVIFGLCMSYPIKS